MSDCNLTTKNVKRANTLKQFVRQQPTNSLSVFDHFVELALKGLNVEELSLNFTSDIKRI